MSTQINRLIRAVGKGEPIESIRKIIGTGDDDLNACWSEALYISVNNADVELSELLLSCGATINDRILVSAAHLVSLEMMKLMHDYGANMKRLCKMFVSNINVADEKTMEIIKYLVSNI